ncbi:MAG: CoA-binding protein [Bryobacteraceae bacterium]
MTPEQQILETCRTIAVVGLSSNPRRPSYRVAEYMQRHGYRIIPVNPREAEVLGEKCYARLEDVPEKIDCVDLFRRPEFVPAITDSAIAIGARALWLPSMTLRLRTPVRRACWRCKTAAC